MGAANKIASGAIWSIVLNIVSAVYGFIAVPILITHYGKGEYGIIGLAMSVNMYMQFMDLGLNSTNVRFFSLWLGKGDKEHVKKLFRTVLSFYSAVGMINTIALVAVTIYSDQIFNVNSDQRIVLNHLLIILALTSFLNWYSSCFDQLIRATENVAWLQKRGLIPRILMIISLFICVGFDISIELYFFLITISNLIIIPLSVLKIRKETGFVSFLPSFDYDVIKEILPYSLGIFSFSMFEFSFHALRPLFLGIRGTVESVADYKILDGITGIVSLLGGVVMGAMLPSVTKVVARDDTASFNRVVYDGTKFLTIVLCFCVFGLININEELLTVYVGCDFLYLSPWLVLWLIFTLGSHNCCISTIIFAGADLKMVSVWSAVSSVLGLVSAWFLIPYFQVGGVVIAYCIYIMSQALFYYLYYWRYKLKINSGRVFFSSFIPYVIIGFAVVAVLGYMPSLFSNLWYQLILKSILYTLLFVTLSCLILNKEDYNLLLSIIRRK